MKADEVRDKEKVVEDIDLLRKRRNNDYKSRMYNSIMAIKQMTQEEFVERVLFKGFADIKTIGPKTEKDIISAASPGGHWEANIIRKDLDSCTIIKKGNTT